MNSHILQAKQRGKNVFILDIHHGDGRRERNFFPTKFGAEQKHAALRAQADVSRSIWASMAPREQLETIFVQNEARALGMTQRELLDFYKGNAKSDAVRPQITLGEMIALTINKKRAAGRRDTYIDNLEYVLNQFVKGRRARTVASISTVEIDAWLSVEPCHTFAISVQVRIPIRKRTPVLDVLLQPYVTVCKHYPSE